MLKRYIIKKCILLSALFFSLLLLYIVPNKKYRQNLEYKDDSIKASIYLLDKNGYVALTKIKIKNRKIEAKAKELLEALIKDNEKEENLPNGFRALIPSDTKINSVKYENDILKIDLSNDLLDTKKEYEEKIIESIIYTLTSIEDVNKVIIYIDGKILSYLPKSGINLPSTLDKSYGINKEYDLVTYKNISKTTTYYVSKYNDDTYYVPVTKYTNSSDEKIKMIISNLSSTSSLNTNLSSYLNSNTLLLSSNIKENTMELVFNEYIFNDLETKNILEEVLYTISLSVEANYNVKTVSFLVNNEEIYKST